jgi:sucrose phosphorylase
MTVNSRISQLLSEIYNTDITPTLIARLESILTKYHKQISPRKFNGLSERDVLLIVYPDQILEPGRTPLESLFSFCEQYLTGLITGIHILPFYPWSSDDGFSVIDYRDVDPKYGSWEDITGVGNHFRLMFDAVINHTSVHSPWFEGFLQDNKLYKDYYIDVHGNPDLSNVIRPRALPLLTHFNTPNGPKAVWTTFSSDQADLNYHNPDVLMDILDILLLYIQHGAEIIRLDAIAYLWKEIGSNCINLPTTHKIVQLIRATLDEIAPRTILITETNVPQADNLSYFGNGVDEAQLVYNFSLPPLLLHAFQSGNARILSQWAASLKLPSQNVTFFNFLASHDGVGLNPLRNILPETEIDELARSIELRGGLISYKNNADGSQSPYEVNVNYLDALSNPGEPLETTVNRFITAHAILFALVGLPGIYFHSMFGSHGWPEGVNKTGQNRSINREKFNRHNLQTELDDKNSIRSKVYKQLSKLIRIRAEQAVFSPYGTQIVLESNPEIFALLRGDAETDQCVLCLHNVSAEPVYVKLDFPQMPSRKSDIFRDLINGENYDFRNTLSVAPYQAIWLTDRQ